MSLISSLGGSAAQHDSLLLVCQLQARYEWAYEAEVHVFAFLAAASAALEGQATEDWPYQFVSTKEGLPYSGSVAEAIRFLETTGSLLRTQDKLTVTDGASSSLGIAAVLSENRARAPFLRNAIRLSLFAQVTELRSLVMRLPGFAGLAKLQAARSLANSLPLAASGELDQFDPTLKLFGWLNTDWTESA